MAGTSSKGLMKPEPIDDDPVVDLEDYVREWALECYREGKVKGDPHTSDLDFKIDWRKVHFDYEDPLYESMKTFKYNLPRNIHSQVLLRTTYVNDTDKTQEYNFRAERTMKSLATVAVDKGFKTGTELRMCLKAPEEIVEIGGGISREIEIRDLAENSVEEELLFAIDSKVITPPRTETTVKLVMNEALASSPFQMRVYYRGRVMVKLYQKSRQNSYHSTIQGELFDIIDWAQTSRGLKGFNMKDGDAKGAFTEVSGQCNFKFGVEQKAHVTQKPIDAPNPPAHSLHHADLRTLAMEASSLYEKNQFRRNPRE